MTTFHFSQHKQYVIYESPDDYPLRYVLRRWTIPDKGEPIPDTEPLCVHRDISVVRGHIPEGATNKGPSETDKIESPRIVEVWVYVEFGL